MNPKTELSPIDRAARHYVAELLKSNSRGPDTFEANLSRVRSLRAFLAIPGTFAEPNFRDRPEVERIPRPAGTSFEFANHIPYALHQVLTQRVPAVGDLPAYTFPLPGQPVVLIGSPAGFTVPDGARYDIDAERWECEDARIVAMSPMGPVVLTVDVEEFTAWTPDSPVWSEVLEACGKLLEALEADILETMQAPT